MTPRKFILIYSSLFVLLSCNSKQNSLQDLGYKGNVREITSNSFEGKLDGKEIVIGEPSYGENFKLSFNKWGWLTEATHFDNQHIFQHLEIYFYNSNNEINVVKLLDQSNDTTASYKHAYKDGEINTITVFDKSGKIISSYTPKSKYDNKEQTITGANFIEYYKNTFNSKRQLIETSRFDEKHNFQNKQILEYGDDGNVSKETEVNFDKKINHIFEYHYEYDHEGNWIEQTQFQKFLILFQQSTKDEYTNGYRVTIRSFEYYN